MTTIESVLYAEIYLLCIVIVGLCLFWASRSGTDSSSERMLRSTLIAFMVSFGANLLFTLFNHIWVISAVVVPVSYFFKTVYYAFLCVGVYSWCVYAEMEGHSVLFKKRVAYVIAGIPFAALLALIAINLKTHWLFEINEQAAYIRHGMFQLQMGALVALSALFAIRLLIRMPQESDPIKRGHMGLVSSFPLCLLAAWILSQAGENFPIICVFLTVELLCLYVGTSTQQISLDKLTQVNNRLNLMGFMDYKLRNHDEMLYLLLVDADHFKAINDTYGHLEGDEALIRLSGALKAACQPFRKRPYIARYGGDEFIIMLEGSRTERDTLCESINREIQTINEVLRKPYTLSVSIGIADYMPGMTSKDFISAADDALYAIKKGR